MGWPGSRAKVEFNSWENREGSAENSTKETKIRASLEGVILPQFSIRFLGSKCFTKRLPGKSVTVSLSIYIVLRYTGGVLLDRGTIQLRYEEAYLVRLPGIGGVPFPDPPLPPLQRASGEAGRPGARPVSTDAGHQGDAARGAAANSRTGHPHANPPPQRRRTGEPPGS